MAYCLKCGAYIPDGQTVCLACGYNPADELKKKAESKKSRTGGSAYQYSSNNEELRRRLEEQRKRTQEKNRQWAEQERVRREEQAAREEARKEQQERSRQWAQEEYERRQAEQYAQSGEGDYTVRKSGEGNKALAAISYLSILFALPYIFTPNDEYAKFHAKQGMKLFLFGIGADILAGIIGLGWLATLARFYLIYKGMTNALNGKKEPLPYIGTLGDQ